MIALSSDYTCEQDYSRLAQVNNLGFDLYVNHIHFNNPITVQSLAVVLDSLLPVETDMLPGGELDALVFSCTAASASVAQILQAGHKKFSLLVPYELEVNWHLADDFEHSGLDIQSLNYMRSPMIEMLPT